MAYAKSNIQIVASQEKTKAPNLRQLADMGVPQVKFKIKLSKPTSKQLVFATVFLVMLASSLLISYIGGSVKVGIIGATHFHKPFIDGFLTGLQHPLKTIMWVS